MLFESILGVAAIIAGAIATVAGFGIGSVLMPIFALRTGSLEIKEGFDQARCSASI